MVEIPAFIRIYFGSRHPSLTELVAKAVCSRGTQAVLLTFLNWPQLDHCQGWCQLTFSSSERVSVYLFHLLHSLFSPLLLAALQQHLFLFPGFAFQCVQYAWKHSVWGNQWGLVSLKNNSPKLHLYNSYRRCFNRLWAEGHTVRTTVHFQPCVPWSSHVEV